MIRLNRIVLPLLCVGFVACASAQQDSGEDVARHLTNRYANTDVHCGALSQPAFLCNGVLIRGTSNDPGSYHVWDPSPTSISRGGVSASYLRSDANFKKLAYSYNNGYILTAYSFADGKLHPEVLCFFPADAGTESRTDHGCGDQPASEGSGPCHLQGITTAAQWFSHFSSHGNQYGSQCGFDVRDERNSSAGSAFIAGLEAMSLLGAQPLYVNNELILAAWSSGAGKTLPLEAFFYLAGSEGLPVAKHNQNDLMTTDGVWIPVIKITLPQSSGDKATFTYSAADQAIINAPD